MQESSNNYGRWLNKKTINLDLFDILKPCITDKKEQFVLPIESLNPLSDRNKIVQSYDPELVTVDKVYIILKTSSFLFYRI